MASESQTGMASESQTGIQMSGLFKSWTSKSIDFKCFGYFGIRNLDPHCKKLGVKFTKIQAMLSKPLIGFFKYILVQATSRGNCDIMAW